MEIWAIRVGILACIAAILLTQSLTLDEYSIVANAISELAGQGMPFAWIMRAGFIVFGAGALASALAGIRRNPPGRIAVAVFGLGMIGAGIWSHAPIRPDMPVDPQEDFLHSIAASLLGTAFALAALFRIMAPGGSRRDLLGWTALVASVAIPLFMMSYPGLQGLPQRAMFAISFVWLWREFRPVRTGT